MENELYLRIDTLFECQDNLDNHPGCIYHKFKSWSGTTEKQIFIETFQTSALIFLHNFSFYLQRILQEKR